MGHNGGFNPFRDANGEFTTPQGSGKPGRSRKGGANAAAFAPPIRSFTDGKLTSNGFSINAGYVGGRKVGGVGHAEHIGQQIVMSRGQPRAQSRGELVDRLVDVAANSRADRGDLLPVLRSLDTRAAVEVERMK